MGSIAAQNAHPQLRPLSPSVKSSLRGKDEKHHYTYSSELGMSTAATSLALTLETSERGMDHLGEASATATTAIITPTPPTDVEKDTVGPAAHR